MVEGGFYGMAAAPRTVALGEGLEVAMDRMAEGHVLVSCRLLVLSAISVSLLH